MTSGGERMVGQYRKKPVVIEAVQIDSLDYDGMCEIVKWCGGRATGGEDQGTDTAVIAIDTLEGTMYADPGDWIIRGVKGEFYPCKPDIFDATYEPVVDGGVNESDEITPKEPYPEGGTRRQIREWRYRNEPCTVCCRPPKDGHIPGKDCGGYGKDV